ncbi:MAG TPA: hypothetical protein VKU44_11945 [Terriglobia bacterium]|nr:hypothetical protein [Terriglobia bacterium]
MAETSSGNRVSIMMPAAITLLVTILRLVGELQHWSPKLFNTEAGGGGALVGISWLPIIFGPYFALKLAGAGDGPASKGKAIGLSLASLPVLVVGGFLVGKSFSSGSAVLAIVGFVVMFAAAFVARAGWPSLGTTLLKYAYAARIPVLIVMFIAFKEAWATHYTALPPQLASAPFWRQFLDAAVLPQLLLWTGFTVVVGSIFGTVVAALAGKTKPAVQTATSS